MGSVIATWRARLPDRVDQARLIGLVERLGIFVNDLRTRYQGSEVPAVTRLLSGQRGGDLAPIPLLRQYDGGVAGRILVNFDLFPGEPVEPGPLGLIDRESALADARNRGLRLAEEEGLRFVVLERATLHGVDFQVFDPRNLYPGSDRMGFVFLGGTGWPLIDGLIVDVAEASRCSESRIEAVRSADYHLSLPYIHLRYLLEGWCQCFFGWMRHYHVPGLEYTAHETNEGFDELDGAFGSLDESVGRLKAEEMLFEKLLSDHGEEVAKWVDDLRDWAAREASGN